MSDNTDQPPPPDSEGSGTPVVPVSPTKAESNVVLGFRPQDRRIMTVLISALLLWLVIEWIVVATRRPDPLLLQRGAEFHASFRVNVNESIWVDWMQLEGIGPSLAQRIVAYRRLNGAFSSIEDVARVPGIGPATLDRIRPWLTMGHDEYKTRSANADSPRAQGTQPATNERQPTAL
ncbi:MAG: helix-hairpin-helix domain-containing protein [Planctomycetaceae bacterium]